MKIRQICFVIILLFRGFRPPRHFTCLTFAYFSGLSRFRLLKLPTQPAHMYPRRVAGYQTFRPWVPKSPLACG